MGEQTRLLAERFMKALQTFEADGNADPLVTLFHDDAECANLVHAGRGRDGVRKFWDDYRQAFETVRSSFSASLLGDSGAALEWESEGVLAGGAAVAYRGVSVLEIEGGRVKRFRTYYDSAAFAARTGK